ncbi:DUF5131 family protein [Archangium violaceum]|uniref:DUF5131 family protein n=1 Tax=Archangium violaceum TaxID=83451 RepID=UPI00193B4598|nr:DUF5131 family protein [Archangium violaceum]QRK08093.1 DUF5131 family protein [Archangium violaceum]
MAENSSIEWTHHTFNPWRGCSKVHAGCTHCYAEKNQGVAMQGITWGEVWQGGQRVVKAESGWREPLKWARDAARAGERRRVFCASLADVLEVPQYPPSGQQNLERMAAVGRAQRTLDAARARLWDVIRQTTSVCGECGGRESTHVSRGFCARTRPGETRRLGGLDWLLLTKRPENWRLVPEDVRPLVWLGTSTSDQKTADEWVPRLLKAEGFRLRFLSVEPLVGPVDLGLLGTAPAAWGYGYRPISDLLNWVIVGGESGPKARPCNVEWVRDIVRQCREAGVPCFVKQLGAYPTDLAEPPGYVQKTLRRCSLSDPKGGDMSEWPEDLRVREFPEVRP